MRTIIKPAIITSLCIPFVSYGIPDAGSILQEEINSINYQAVQAPENITSPEKDKTHRYKFLKTKIYVKEFIFTGDTGVLMPKQIEELNKIIAPFFERKLSIQKIQYISALVTNKLQTYGYALPAVILPNQEIVNGIVKLHIFIGRLDDTSAESGITINSSQRPHVRKNIIIQRIKDPLYENPNYLEMSRLERSAILVNELSGISSTLRFAPGSEPGTTKIVADLKNTNRYSLGGILDNTGSRYTGVNKAMAFAGINSPMRAGDQAKIQTVQSKGLNLYGVDYKLPLMPNGLNINLNFMRLHYRLGQELTGLAYKGDANYINASLKYPVKLCKKTNISASLDFSNKILIDQANGLISKNKRLNTLAIKLDGHRLDKIFGGGKTGFMLSLTTGVVNLRRNSANFSADQSGPKTNGGFKKINFKISRQQKIIDNTLMKVSLSGQMANKNLDSSEKMTVGGLEGIMGYPAGEGSSSQGVLFKTELSYKYPESFKFGNVTLKGFYQVASLKQNYDLWNGWNSQNTSAPNRYQLHGVGAGLGITNNKNLVLNINYGLKLGKNPNRTSSGNDSDGINKRSRVIVQLMYIM